MLVPKLRFQSEDGTDYPEWCHSTLSEISERVTRKNKGNVTDIPLTLSSLYGLVDQREYFKKKIASQNMARYYLLNRGEFAYNKSYSQGFDFGAVKRLDKYDCGALSPLYLCFSVSKDVDSDFMTHYFDSQKWNRELSVRCAEGVRNHGQLNISKNDFFDIDITLPAALEEQQKIADFLSTVSEAAAQSEAKVQNLEQQKKAAVQKIFSQEVRFVHEDGTAYPEWREYYLEDVATFLDTERKAVAKKFRRKGQYPYYGASGIIDYVDNYIFDEELVLLSEDGTNIVSRNYRVSFVATEKYWVNNHAHCLRVKEGFISYFIAEALETIDYTEYSTGSAQPKLKKEVCRKLPIICPCIEEQQKIADFLSGYDEAISCTKQELEYWKQFKKGLLQQMFI